MQLLQKISQFDLKKQTQTKTYSFKTMGVTNSLWSQTCLAKHWVTVTASLAWTLPGKVTQQHGETFQKKGLESCIIAIFCLQIYHHGTYLLVIFVNILLQCVFQQWLGNQNWTIQWLPTCTLAIMSIRPNNIKTKMMSICILSMSEPPAKPSQLYTFLLFNIPVDGRKVGRS